MELLAIGLGIIVILLVINAVLTHLKNKSKSQIVSNEENVNLDEKLPYVVTQSVLTSKEKKFYEALKPIAEKHGLIILCKVRIADIVCIPKETSNYIKWFNYIKAKHIDFTLCDSEFTVKFLIEVDDSTHDQQKRKERDEFVNRVFEKVGVKLLRFRTWTTESLNTAVDEALEEKNEVFEQQKKSATNPLE